MHRRQERTFLPAFSGSGSSKSGQLGLGRFGEAVAVRFAAFEHQQGNDYQLPRGGHHGHIAAFAPGNPPAKHAKRTRIGRQMLSSLGQEPASVRVAGFGDRSVAAGAGRLSREGHSPR